ncbi:rho GTPase-activating protein 24 isoform X1 [Silurus meridionalis]|nr:rho GTPase-activating protein 24 isoform X1 [Silurus meridionalis]
MEARGIAMLEQVWVSEDVQRRPVQLSASRFVVTVCRRTTYDRKGQGAIFLPGNRVTEHPCSGDEAGKFLFEVVPVGRYGEALLFMALPQIMGLMGVEIISFVSLNATFRS